LVKVDFYKLNRANQVVDSLFTGCLYPKSTRGFDTETFWFPLVTENDPEFYTFYLRLKGGISLEAPFEIGTFNRLLKMKTSSDALALLFIGAMLLMFAYNLMVFFSTKDRIYLTYSFYIISVMLGTTFLNNYPIIESLIGNELTYSFTASWLVTTFIGVGFLGIRYLNMKVNYTWFFHAIRIELLILVIYGFLNFFIPSDYLEMSYEIVVSIFYGTAILAAFFIFRKERNSKTGLYALGWSLMISGSFVYLLVINDVLIYTAITRNAMYFGVTSEVLIFSIALARRLNELKVMQERLNAELELTNEALRINNESLDSFNYHVSHDLKTVLNNSNALAPMVNKYSAKKDNEKVAEIAQKLINVTANGA